MTLSPTWYVALAALLFSLGAVVVLARRHVLVLLLGLELMLGAVCLTLAAYAARYEDADGQVFAFLVLAVVAAEMAVGVGIVLARFRWLRLGRGTEPLARLVDTIQMRNHALTFLLGAIFILWFLVAG